MISKPCSESRTDEAQRFETYQLVKRDVGALVVKQVPPRGSADRPKTYISCWEKKQNKTLIAFVTEKRLKLGMQIIIVKGDG